MKKCTKCGIEKLLSEFHKDKTLKDGHRSECKTCRSQQGVLYRQENKEKIAKKKALYRQQNKEKIAEWNARYRQQNKEKIAEYQARYHQENKEKIHEYQARYRQENKEKIAEYKARYRQENKEKIAEGIARYHQQNNEKIAEYKARYRQENKEKIAEWNARYHQQNNEKQPACVYQIINKKNGKIYIGETLRGKLRWKNHLRDLRGEYHKNRLLQEDFDKFGEEAFEWEIVKELPKDKESLLLEEVRTISRFLKEGKDLYNLSLTIEQLKLLQENGE